MRGVRPSHDALSTTVQSDEAKVVAGTEGDPRRRPSRTCRASRVPPSAPGTSSSGARRRTRRARTWTAWRSRCCSTAPLCDRPSTAEPRCRRDPRARSLRRRLRPRARGSRPRSRRAILPGSKARTPTSNVDALDGSAMSLVSARGPGAGRGRTGRYGWLDQVIASARHGRRRQPLRLAVPPLRRLPGKDQRWTSATESSSEAAFRRGSRERPPRRSIPDADPSRQRTETTGAEYERFYLRYRRSLSDTSSVEVTPWVGRDVSSLDAQFGATPASLDTSTWRSGLRAVHRSRVTPWMALSMGVEVDDARADVSRSGSLEVPAAGRRHRRVRAAPTRNGGECGPVDGGHPRRSAARAARLRSRSRDRLAGIASRRGAHDRE